MEEKSKEVVNESNDSTRTKQRRFTIKPPINTLSFDCDKISSTTDNEKFKEDLDNIAEKFCSQNELLLGVKKAFVKNKVDVKKIYNLLQADFKEALVYDNNGLLGLHRAVIDDNIQEVERRMIILKALKKNVDICTQNGQTSLELAIITHGSTRMIEWLLNAGAQVVSSRPIHNTSLILAAKNSLKIIPMLLKYVKKENWPLLNNKDEEGFAAIHYCAQEGDLEGVSELLKCGAEVNVQDERYGKTPLFYSIDSKSSNATQEICYKIAFKLLEHGARSDIVTFSKHSVLSLIDSIQNHTLKIALNRAVKY